MQFKQRVLNFITAAICAAIHHFQLENITNRHGVSHETIARRSDEDNKRAQQQVNQATAEVAAAREALQEIADVLTNGQKSKDRQYLTKGNFLNVLRNAYPDCTIVYKYAGGQHAAYVRGVQLSDDKKWFYQKLVNFAILWE